MALIKPEQLRSGSYNITGSLFGTASYATQALTASYTLNETPTFPFSGSAVITGSLVISGSGLTVTGSISTSGSNGTINGLFVSLGGGNVPSNISIGATTNFSPSNTGTHNFAAGNNALYNNTTGNNNTAIGQSSLQYNTTGCHNTAIGDRALRNNTIGSYNIAFGKRTDSGNYSYSVILGKDATATANNQFVVGAQYTNVGTVVASSYSSTKYWEVMINGVLEKILLA